MEKIGNKLFICALVERRNELFIFSLNKMIHVNKKTIKEAIILFPFFLLHYLSLFKNSPMLLLFYYSLC